MMLTPSQDKSRAFASSRPTAISEISRFSTPSQEPSTSRHEPAEIRITMPTMSINNEVIYAKQACFLRKICGLLASTNVWVVLALNDTDFDTKLESLFSIICCCVAYITFENLFLCMGQELPHEDFKERIFDVLDGILALYFLVIIMFCDRSDTSKYLLMVSPCLYLVLTSIYVRQLGGEAPSMKNCSKVTRRLLCSIQVWVITAKILGYIALGWMTTFIPLGFLLVGYQIYGSYTLIKSAIQLFRTIGEHEMNAFSFVRRCVKISWYLLFCGFYPLALSILLTLCQEAERVHNKEFMGILLTIAEYYCSFFLGYTLVFFRLMKKFDIDLRLEHQEEEEIKVKTQQKGLSVKIQKEGDISFFKRISPTFFVRADKKNEKIQEDLSEEVNDSRSTGTEEPLCYICETNDPDVILVDCGHGGMCKNCLLLSMKKNKNCMECRRPVRSVYQIKNEVETGIVEAVEAFNIV